MFPINQFKITTKSASNNQAVFAVGPLPKGYANTLGTVLRRILLSSIPGAAITAVRMSNVQHEYTTIAGLQDEVLSVILAMKEVAVVSHSNEPVELTLNVKGKKGGLTITAGDIEKNPMVEIINPEFEISTLADEKSELVATIVVEKGIGYMLPDDGKRTEVGTIPVDAIFSPVKLVSIKSNNTRVGQQTDLDELEVTVVTNGTVPPTMAMHQAAEILNTMTVHLVDATKDLMDEKTSARISQSDLPIADEKEEAVEELEPILVSDMNLSTRLTNALVNSNYENLRDLEGLTEEELRNVKGMGEKSFNELLDILKDNGIELI